ncbi:MAG: TIR domain-containing protein [Bacteroidales bacterium]|nr:TIR domain-containing protein [Bacteroidales bacterium]
MPELKNYRLFISHSWAYGDAYERLVGFFNEHPLFKWTNYSVPKDDPIHNAKNEKDLYDAIKAQVSPVNCVVILAGVYSTYSKWINKEIEISKQIFNKPIVAVEGWGAERTSAIVKNNADIVVRWNSTSIVEAIRNYSL